MDQLISEESKQEDTIEQEKISKSTDRRANDRECTQDEVRHIIESFNPRKAPGLDGVTGAILILIFQSIPQTLTAIYNECLKRGHFPEEWMIAKIIPITKPG